MYKEDNSRMGELYGEVWSVFVSQTSRAYFLGQNINKISSYKSMPANASYSTYTLFKLFFNFRFLLSPKFSRFHQI